MPESASPQTFMTTDEVAQFLNVSTGTVRRLAKEGRIPSHRLGHRTIRYRAEEVETALRKGDPDHASDKEVDALVEQVVQDARRSTSALRRAGK